MCSRRNVNSMKMSGRTAGHRTGKVPAKIVHAIVAGGLALMTAVSAQARISQVPLVLQNRVPPNFTFVLDDSGSMQFAFVRAGGGIESQFTNYIFPPPDALYGDGNYTEYVPTFDDSNVHNLLARSAANNAVFYDPTVVYEPWSASDSSQMDAADPGAALYNPSLTAKGTLDLTQEQQDNGACWISHPSDPADANGCYSETYWPITYYIYDGSGDRLNSSSYAKVEVRDGTIYKNGSTVTSVTAPPAADDDTWDAADIEQNFANWFQYHRSRILAARAGVGAAFARQGSGFRVGWGSINSSYNDIDGEYMDTLIRGVRDFEGAQREDFFDFLYGHVIPYNVGTPLRRSLQDVGQYYERSDSGNPWKVDPASGGEELGCRRNYTILTTDGFWNGGSAGVGNADNTDGSIHANPGGEDIGYVAEPPYSDGHSNTLADVAIDFWKRDLRTDLDNNVPIVPGNPAYWQHMATYGVAFGAAGTLNPDDDLGDLSAGDIDWPDPTDTEDAERIDDLWHASVNSRGGFLSARQPDVFAEEFQELLEAALNETRGSAASIATNSGQIDTGARIYQARFDSTRWSGELMAFGLASDGTIDADGDGEIDDDALWRASENIPSHDQRALYTWNPADGSAMPFTWASLTTDQQNALIDDDDQTAGQNRLAWLRGDYAQELQNGGSYRNRETLSDGTQNVLGDIVNSSPYLAAKRDFGFEVLGGEEGTKYIEYRFSDTYTDRPNMIYVGANDGMLHAFNAGDPKGDGTATDIGTEEFAFIPSAVFGNLEELTSPDYTHRYYVDEAPRKVDAYIDHDGDGTKTWRSVLIGSTGAGGKSVFALDVTDPTNFSEDDVLWEYTHGSLGYTIGAPTIARLPDGNFYALFGDGYDNADGSGGVEGDGSATARLFIVNLQDGTTERVIDTGVNAESGPNGLSSVIPVDIDQDRVSEAVYAGDLEGNLWKFDLSGDSSGDWGIASLSGGGGNDPLFTAEGPSGEVQPIVVRPEVVEDPDDGVRTILFGTGKRFEEGDQQVDANPDVQTTYAIRDTGSTVDRSDLLEQQISSQTTKNGTEYRIVTTNSPTNQSDAGWRIDLRVAGGEAMGERVIEDVIVRGERAIFVSEVPPENACDFAGTSWLYEVDAFTGGRLDNAVVDVDGDGRIDSSDTVGDDDELPSGIKMDGLVTRPTILEGAGNRELKFMSRATGGIVVQEESDSTDSDYGRASWRQLR